MRRLLCIGLILITGVSRILAQESFSDYKAAYQNLDISKMSGSMLYMLNEQMKSIDKNQYEQFIQSKRADIYSRLNLGTKDAQKAFLANYNQNLLSVRNSILANDVLMRVDPSVIANYGCDVLSRYQGNYASTYVSTLLQQVIKAKLALYTADRINEASQTVLSDAAKLSSISEQIIAYWKVTGINIPGIQHDTAAIRQKVTAIINQIAIADSVKNFILQSATVFSLKLQEKLQSGWSGTIDAVRRDKAKYLQQFTALYQTYAITVKDKTEQTFHELGAAIDSLSKNESIVYQTLGNIQNDWSKTKAAISDLENQMLLFKDNPLQLQNLSLQHAQLVSENFIRLDVISKYVNRGAQIYKTLSLVKSQVFDKITDPQKRDDFIKSLSLDNLTLPTLSDAFSSAAGLASQVAKTFPDCKPLQTVATAANYLMSAVNIVSGVAELYSMNPMGLVNIFSGLSGIFGGKPEPSPEMKMMQQMMDYMQGQFQNIDKHLQYIEGQLSNLTDMVQSMYKDMMKSFQVVNTKLDLILWENNTLYNATRVLVFKDMAACQNLEEIRKPQEEPAREFNTYQDINAFYQGSPDQMGACLPTLREFSTKLLQNVFSFSLSQPGQELSLGGNDLQNADIIETKSYRPMTNIFSSFYGNDCAALNALGIPGAKISTNGSNYMGVKNINSCLNATADNTLGTYYNYATIKDISELLITYSNFYLLQNANQPAYFPSTLLQFLSLPPQSIADRYAGLENNFQFLLDLVNKAIAQQSLMAGNNVLNVAYNYLLGNYNANAPNSAAILENTIVALENNSTFAKNFASLLVFGSINRNVATDTARSKRFNDLYFCSSPNRKDTFNTEFTIPLCSFDVDNTNTLILRVNGRGRPFTIPVPSPAFIINDEMAQSDGLYTLLQTKKELVEKLIDLTYFNHFIPVACLNKDDYKYLIQDLDSSN